MLTDRVFDWDCKNRFEKTVWWIGLPFRFALAVFAAGTMVLFIGPKEAGKMYHVLWTGTV